MNDKLILDLTVRLTQALDQNYDVVNMETVLAVLSALEGATITKEQLETTRLAKHINQLRRRNKSNILAIRAKNLLKTWREMVGITSQAQSEVAATANLQVQSIQQQATKPPLSNSAQPTSPYANQLLNENLDNSLSSIGGGVEFSRTAVEGVINTGSVSFAWNKKSLATSADSGGGAGIVSSRSNGALADTQTRLTKSSNRSSKNSNSPNLPGTTSKVKHPTSFKNLLTGFNSNSISSKKTPSTLSPKVKPQMSIIGKEEPGLKISSTTFVIDDDDNQSQPLTATVVQAQISSPRTHKSTKRKDRDSPVVFIEHSSSPTPFDNISEDNKIITQIAKNSGSNQIVTSTIDLPDSNSSLTFTNALCDTTENGGILNLPKETPAVREDRQKHAAPERIEQATESEHFQPNIDESSRIAFPISGIQEYLSLSNSSMSIFPSQQTAGSDGTERYVPKMDSNNDNQHINSSNERNSEVVDGNLTFAGKFKQNSDCCGVEVGPTGNYYSNGKEDLTLTTSDFACSNVKGVDNNCRDSLSAGGTASTSTFLPYSRNSNESTSNSRASQLDLIDVVNQDSQSVITADDLHQQEQSSNVKSKTSRDVETVPDIQHLKYTKETGNKSKQPFKEQKKPAVIQRPINTSSNSSTPIPAINMTTAASSIAPHTAEQKVPKKRGRKKGSKGVDSVLAQISGLSSQFLVSPALGSSKKVKTTMELLADIQNRKLGSATSSPTLMNWLGTSRPASSCSEPSLHSPRTSDACSTNATISTAARSTPEKNISNNSVGADDLYESDSDSNTSEPSHDSVKVSMGSRDSISKSREAESAMVSATAVSASTIEAQIKDLLTQLPPVNVNSIDWEAYEDVPCTCAIREIPPEAVMEIDNSKVMENGFELLKNVGSIKTKDDNQQNDDEPIISVNVLPPVQPQQLQESSVKPWSTTTASLLHSLSAPASTVTSPVVPSTNQKMKSIFDLDFDDDNDPLHSFVEAASKTQILKDSLTSPENGRTINNEDISKQKNAPRSYHSDVVKSETQQSEPTQRSSPNESEPYQNPTESLEMVGPIQPLANFPTYEVVEDPKCQAKLRYETQTNQITQFHIHAFHNCFIPNVNGNWDHSVPQNLESVNQQIENDKLYADVVPKYGCFVTERIPKDLSHVKFTKNFKPKYINKSDKPPPLFLGVANIHRRQHFRLYHNNNPRHRHHKKTGEHRKRHTKMVRIKLEIDQKCETPTKQKIEFENKRGKESEEKATNILSHIPEKVTTENTINEVTENTFATKHRLSLTYVPEISQIKTHNTNNYTDKSYLNQRRIHSDVDVADINFFSVIGDIDESKGDRGEDQEVNVTNIDQTTDFADVMPVANGTVHLLTNNNTIVHSPVEGGQDEVPGNVKKILQNKNHGLLVNDKESELAPSRRSSSCSNSSLKQNQNSINLKLRRHRLAQRQAEMQKRHRKRKSKSSFNDAFEFEMEDDGQPRNPPLIKRIKIVNGGLDGRRRKTNSITDSSCMEEDGDSDCYALNSENDIITEEEIDEDVDDQVPKEIDAEDDYEDVGDDYDEEDGDDEEEPEEDYGDFREVVTRDMTSSTTGNNHIVLTIKKTPSKTNSPSSSSMSPAPVLNTNVKQKSPSPNIRTMSTVLESENPLEDSVKKVKRHGMDSLGCTNKFSELNEVKSDNLIRESKLVLPEQPCSLAVYSFEVKKNGDIEPEDSANENNDANGTPYENEVPEENSATETTEGVAKSEKSKHTSKVSQINSNDLRIITKAKLSDSILLTRRELRRLELQKHMKAGIKEAQKLHHQLFFPYELHTSIGSKILEIDSCTSGCTDPSGGETDITDSNTSHSSTDDEDALFRVHKRKRIKPPVKREKIAPGGGGDPSSSSSSNTSDTNSSSSLYSAFTSWTTSSEDEEKNLPLIDKQEQTNMQNSSSNDTEYEKELPIKNNYLLRSFNHIYVSTEERRRQQQLKEGAEHHRREVMNTGYITITGDDSTECTSTALVPSVAPTESSDVTKFNSSTYNIYSNGAKSNGNVCTTGKQNLTADTKSSTKVETLAFFPETISKLSNFELVDTSQPQLREKSLHKLEFRIDQTPKEDLISENLNIPTGNEGKDNTVDPTNCQINANNEIEKKIETCNRTEEVMVPQEEYRTGLRQVDEDVDDEDGNNCARTQQFKEWHEVLQLRSYNDELLTVLPYVVIE